MFRKHCKLPRADTARQKQDKGAQATKYDDERNTAISILLVPDLHCSHVAVARKYRKCTATDNVVSAHRQRRMQSLLTTLGKHSQNERVRQRANEELYVSPKSVTVGDTYVLL